MQRMTGRCPADTTTCKNQRMHGFHTAAANRALHLAADVAHHLASPEVLPEHLLWALLLDESRASELLTSRGVSAATLNALCALPQPFDAPAGDARPAIPESVSLQLIGGEAWKLAVASGNRGEVGSEHLLFAAALVESPAQDLLHAHGIRADHLTLGELNRDVSTAEPIPAEIRLHLPTEKPADLTDTYRILDAAANRAREGLRVLEDYVRFSLDDTHLTRLLKNWRHDFSRVFARVDERALLQARATPQDVGTSIHTRHEATRETLLDVVRAGFKRVQEAVRTLEEYGKVVSQELGSELGRLRYDLYTLEKGILATQSSGQRLAGRHLYLLVTEALCLRGSGPVIRSALAAGAGLIQIREKEMPDRLLLEHSRRVREWTHAAGALLIINDRPDLAVLSGADGVHVGQDELAVRDARRILGPDKLVGVSTHSIEQARQAVLDGADYIGVGPTFRSTTKNFRQLSGLDFVRQVGAEIALPAFAIGGIGLDNIDEVLAAGTRRVAVSSAICSAEDPGEATRTLCGRIVATQRAPVEDRNGG